MVIFDAETIRTSDHKIRNLVLYPAELQHLFFGAGGIRLPALICYFLKIRSRRDSNPRYPCGAQLLSREPDSASLAPLQGCYF